MLKLLRHRQFLKEYAKIRLNDQQYSRYVRYLSVLLQEEQMPSESKDHSLKGNYQDCREFHISGDILVIYRIEVDTVQLLRIGSHSELFSR
jgi:mRNA interferase YafQ